MLTDMPDDRRRRRGHTLTRICGSRREGSYTRRALEEALVGVEAAGGTTELLEFAEIHLPPLDPASDGAGDADVVRRTIRRADAVILGTPLYHGSYSGALKNALDYRGFDGFENTTAGSSSSREGRFPRRRSITFAPSADRCTPGSSRIKRQSLRRVPRSTMTDSWTRTSESAFGRSGSALSSTQRSNR